MNTKQLVLTLLFIFSILGVKAQTDSISKPHDLSLNAFNLVVFQAFDVSIEKYIDEESSMGFSVLINLLDKYRDTNGPYYTESFVGSVFYRLYFGQKPNSGFFAEAFTSYSTGYNTSYDYIYDYYACPENIDCVYPSFNHAGEKFSALGVGFSVGAKWQLKKNMSYSILFGVGRNIVTDEGYGAIPRLGISFGKRFD